MVRSRTRFKPLADVFRSTSADMKAMHVQIARVCVLYEDLQIEAAGAQADELKALDGTSLETRRFYFVRRTLATLAEIEQALHKLNSNKAFDHLKNSMSREARKAWDAAIKFFSIEHEFLKNWRNDIGGHFLDDAATYALDNMQASTVGSIELYRRGNGADVKMPFAYELVAVAMTKNKGATTEEEFLKRALTFLVEAGQQAVSAIQIVTNVYLYDRFK